MSRSALVLGLSVATIAAGIGGYFGVRAWASDDPRRSTRKAKAELREVEPAPRTRPRIRAATNDFPDDEVLPEPPASPSLEEEPAPVKWTSAEAERDHFVAKLKSSGSAPGQLIEEVRVIERDWREVLAQSESSLELGAWQCFQGGCTVTGTYKDEHTTRALLNELSVSDAAGRVGGPRFQSGPVALPSGEFEVTWIFFAPGGLK